MITPLTYQNAARMKRKKRGHEEFSFNHIIKIGDTN